MLVDTDSIKAKLLSIDERVNVARYSSAPFTGS
jgi:hypothetical protein